MHVNEMPRYLANLLILAGNGQGVLSPAQEIAFEAVGRELNANREDLIQARRLASESEPLPLQRYSERLRNLEDVLFLAMSEGYLPPETKTRILDYAGRIGVARHQMRELAEQTRSRFTHQRSQFECPACDGMVSSHYRFCPRCGHQLEPGELPGPADPGEQPPANGLTLEFEAGRAPEDLGRHLRQAGQSLEFNREGRRLRRVTWSRRQIAETLPLIEHLRKTGAEVKLYLDGKPQSWNEIFGFLDCLAVRRQSYRPQAHCFGLNEHSLNIWGCKQAGMNWEQDAEWLTHGYFESREVFFLDKNQLRHELEQRLHCYRFCPHLNPGRVEQAVQALPSRILLNTREETEEAWQYQTLTKPTPRALPLETKARGAPVFAIGVQPADYRLARKIIAKVFPDNGLREILQG